MSHLTVLFRTLLGGSVASLAVMGCTDLEQGRDDVGVGDEFADEDDDFGFELDPDDSLDEEGFRAASDVPPPGSGGLQYVGRGHLKNGTGLCAYRTGSKVSTQPCADVPSQIFSAYKMADGRYNLCTPGSFAWLPSVRDYTRCTTWYDQRECEYAPAYVAECLYQQANDVFTYRSWALSFDRGNGYEDEGGQLSYSGGVAKFDGRYNTGNYVLTRDNNGRVAARANKGKPSQTWTVY